MANGDVLPVIFFSVLFGYFITKVAEKPRTQLSDLFQAAFDVMLKLTLFVVWSALLGLFGIIARIVARLEGESLAEMGELVEPQITPITRIFLMIFVTTKIGDILVFPKRKSL